MLKKIKKYSLLVTTGVTILLLLIYCVMTVVLTVKAHHPDKLPSVNVNTLTVSLDPR